MPPCRLLPPILLGLLTCFPLPAQPPAQAPDSRKGLGQGAGDLMILPTRIILEGRVRASEVMLKNQGKTAATFRIFIKEMEMAPDGRLQDRTKASGETTAADLVRYTPRQAELAPGEAQTVRIQLRKPGALPDGEYRSHLVFQGIPPAEPPQPEGADGEKKLTITIRPVYGISIPIIVRHGETRASLSLGNPRFRAPQTEGAPPAVLVDLERQGNRSVMGDIEVAVEAGGSLKKGTLVAVAKGIAVYHTLPAREVTLPLQLEKGASIQGARLKISFIPQDIKLPPVVAHLVTP